MKEFRLVFYMNGSDAIDFWGGRAAASPLAYSFHLNKQTKSKVFLGGSLKFIGLGKYGALIKDELESAPKPISLPTSLSIDGEPIRISNKAYIYQNSDPLLTQAEHEVHWEATINALGRFTPEDREEHMLGALSVGPAASGTSVKS